MICALIRSRPFYRKFPCGRSCHRLGAFNSCTSRGQTLLTLKRPSKSSCGDIRDHRVLLRIPSDRREKYLNEINDFHSKMCRACSQQHFKSSSFCDVYRAEVLLLPLNECKFIVSFDLHLGSLFNFAQERLIVVSNCASQKIKHE